MEAGNRCFDQRVPEEINRKIVDHTADINMPYSTIAREYLLREGLPPDRIIKTGSPMYEVLMHQKKWIENSDILDRLRLQANAFFLVSAHREENLDNNENFTRLTKLLKTLIKTFNIPIIISTHPRTKKKIEATKTKFPAKVHILRPLGFHDYVKLQTTARATLSDSGTISEESSILKFPALNIREAHERPEAMEEAAVMMTGLREEWVLSGLAILERQKQSSHRGPGNVQDYFSPNVSEKVVKIILSYTHYVNRVVWSK